ncbi:glycyl-tRNA synthetase subunit alpha (plasmid) [Nostoc sp. NIES-2111]|nr:glycyl-tRNA synthetase subunit alpha [Nostoc sp. NIES-2111]
MLRKAKLPPSFWHYVAQTDQEEILVLVLKGHLVIEALLVELIQLTENSDQPWRWNFPSKVKKCIELNYLTTDMGDALLNINDLRNDLAHILGHSITFDRVFELAQKVGNAGFAFSDETIYLDKQQSEDWYGIFGVLMDILNSIYFDLGSILYNNGGENRLGG